jgi:predicted DNA-binding protein
MYSIKTAISLNNELYKKIEELSKKLKIPKSRIFSQAVEYFIEKNENLELLKKINESYADEVREINPEYSAAAKKSYSKILDKW